MDSVDGLIIFFLSCFKKDETETQAKHYGDKLLTMCSSFSFYRVECQASLKCSDDQAK